MVVAFGRECTETLWEGYERAFEFFGGVLRRTTHDNRKAAVSRIPGRARRLTQGFLQRKGYHLLDHHFCRVALGNEKAMATARGERRGQPGVFEQTRRARELVTPPPLVAGLAGDAEPPARFGEGRTTAQLRSSG